MVIALNMLAVGCLAAICYFDFRWFIIPNTVNVILFLGGLFASAQQGWTSALSALIVAISVGAIMWTIRHVHYRVTGRMGLGLGDVKLAAAAAAWFSLWMLPLFLFVASFSALVFLLASSAGGAKSYTRKIPFGPFLAGALIVTWNTERIYGTSFGALS